VSIVSFATRIAKWSGITFAVILASLAAFLFIMLRAPQVKARTGCPILAWLTPIDHTPINADDYIEIASGGGWSSWVPIPIKIYGDGRVDRDTVETDREGTFGCPLHPDQRTTRVPAEAAKKLLERAESLTEIRLGEVRLEPKEVEPDPEHEEQDGPMLRGNPEQGVAVAKDGWLWLGLPCGSEHLFLAVWQ